MKITILSNNNEHLQQVEQFLHIQKKEIKLDNEVISFLIGTKGERIKQILDNSGLKKIDFSKTQSDSICTIYGNKQAIESGLD